MSKRVLKLGTRGSDLATTQSGTVAASLKAAGYEVELSIIRTSGDNNQTALFGSIGPQGVFVREIEQALVEGRVDFAVHSFKDLPTTSPAGLVVAAVPQRVDPADLLLLRRSALARGGRGDWIPLKQGMRVGTASARRRVWLKYYRPDLVIEPLRGNVPTRVRKLMDGQYDAIVLASAGVARLQAEQRLGDTGDLSLIRLDPTLFVPAPAQGALALQCRSDDAYVLEALRKIDHAASHAAVTAEREALARAEGGCDVAFGAHCTVERGEHVLRAMIERNGLVHEAAVNGPEPTGLGARVWAELDGRRK